MRNILSCIFRWCCMDESENNRSWREMCTEMYVVSQLRCGAISLASHPDVCPWLPEETASNARVWFGLSGLTYFIPWGWINSGHELVLAPSAGQSEVRARLHSASLWLGRDLKQSDSTAWCSHSLSAGSEIIFEMRREDRKCEGLALPSLRLRCVVLRRMPGGLHLYPTHTVSHIAPDTSRACSTHTSCVHTRLSLWSSAAIQRCSAILLRRVINYSLKISALVQSWAW